MVDKEIIQFDIATIEGRVVALMRKYPETRNNDLLLQWIYLQEYLGVKLPPLTYAQLRDGGILGTVSRVRRNIQNTIGILLPTSPEVRLARKIKEEAFKEWAVREKKLVWL